MQEPESREPHSPVPQDQDGTYSALMSGFGHDERDELERLMTDNEERLREAGDGYAP